MANEVALFVAVMNFGVGSKVVKCGRDFGLAGGTIFLGKGTVKKSIFDFLELNEIRKEIVIMGGMKETVDEALIKLKNKFHLEKPGKGIAMSIPINVLMGLPNLVEAEKPVKGGKKPMYNLIYVIVDMGKAEDVLEAAREAGSTGATIMTARGTGNHHKVEKVFNMEIEPQKEILMIISNVEKVPAITEAIRMKMGIDDPGHGVIFTIDINEIHGLYSDEK